MRAWPSDASVAHLIFVDHQTPPTADELAAALDHAARKGARAVRTSAMFPDVAAIVLGWGFEPIDRLALLTRMLEPLPQAPPPAARLGSMMPWHLGRCAQIDRDCFGLMWGNSPASLRDIRTATPIHRSRLARHERRIAGFAVSGAAADTGYLQRLAVAPDRRRLGIARDLVVDSLDWMHRRELRTVLVNTGVGNAAALALYESLGFTVMPDQLTIAELTLA